MGNLNESEKEYVVDYHTIDVLSEIYNWDMKLTDRSIDEKKYKKYLNAIQDVKIKKITQEIVENTIYVTFDRMKSLLIKAIMKLPKKYNVAFFTNMDDKIGSEHWLTILAWPYLKKRCIKVINRTTDITNAYPIVVVDDCIYSGNHACMYVDHTRSYYKERYGKILENEFIYVTTCQSINGTKQLLKDFGKVSVISGMVVEPLEFDFDFMTKHFGTYTDCVIPVYFDHKISNKFGTYTDLYNTLVKNKPSRYRILDLTERMIPFKNPKYKRNTKTNIGLTSKNKNSK